MVTSSHLVVLGTAPAHVVVAAATALRSQATSVTALVSERDEAAIRQAHIPVRRFAGRIGVRSFGLLRTIRQLRPTGVVVVVGDQFAHTSVTTSLNWWRALGLLGRCDIYVSASTQPEVLEGFNASDPSERLFAGGFALLLGVLAVGRPSVAVAVLGVLVALELLARAVTGHPAVRLVPRSAWPVLVDNPWTGCALRPAAITVRTSTPDGTVRVTRITVSSDGVRSTGPTATHDPSPPVMAFYGGSFLFGEGLSDGDTLLWRMASLLPGCRIIHRAVPGDDATAAALRALQDLEAQRPAAVVLVLNDDEAAQGSRGRAWTDSRTCGSHSRFPMADRFALWRIVSAAIEEVRGRLRQRRTIRLLCRRCASLGVPLVLAHSGPDRAGLAARVSRLGAHTIAVGDVVGDVTDADLARQLCDALASVPSGSQPS